MFNDTYTDYVLSKHIPTSEKNSYELMLAYEYEVINKDYESLLVLNKVPWSSILKRVQHKHNLNNYNSENFFRVIINTIRHDYSNYDNLVKIAYYKNDLKIAVLKLIADEYAPLKEYCNNQIYNLQNY